MDSWKTSREKLFSLACREKETYSLFNMSHCLKVTSDFHQICWRVFCPLKIYGKMYSAHQNDILKRPVLSFTDCIFCSHQTEWGLYQKLDSKIYSVLDSAQKCDELFALMSLRSVTDGESLSGVWRWLSQTTELTSVLPQVHPSLQQMQPTINNNLLRPILTKNKYLFWQAFNSNQPLHSDGPLHTGCIIFLFFVHSAREQVKSASWPC